MRPHSGTTPSAEPLIDLNNCPRRILGKPLAETPGGRLYPAAPLDSKKARDGFDALFGCSFLLEVLYLVQNERAAGHLLPMPEASDILLQSIGPEQDSRILLLAPDSAASPREDVSAAADLLLAVLFGRAACRRPPKLLAEGYYSRKLKKALDSEQSRELLCRFLLRAAYPGPEHFADLMELQTALEALLSSLREEEHLGYDAFISYRHTPESIAFARKLQAKLEGYRPPRSLKQHQKPFARVFLDKNELACVSSLKQELALRLHQSDFLIVLCTRETPLSSWVDWEIETFLTSHAPDCIVPVLLDGDEQTAFPRALSATGQDYLAANFSPEELKVGKNRTDEEFSKIIAAKLHLSPKEVTQRHKAARYHKMLGGMAAVAALLLAFSAYALTQNRRISAQYEQTLIAQSRYLAQISDDLMQQGDRVRAVQTALAALPAGENSKDRPLVTEAYYALSNAMYAYRDSSPLAYAIEDTLTCEEGSSIASQALSSDGTQLLTISDLGLLYQTDLTTMTQTGPLHPADLDPEATETQFLNAVFAPDGRWLLATGNRVLCWDPKSGKLQWQCDANQNRSLSISNRPASFIFCKSLNRVLISFAGDGFSVDLETGAICSLFKGAFTAASLSSDETLLACTLYSSDPELMLYDVAAGGYLYHSYTGDGTSIQKTAYLANGSIALLRTDDYGGTGFVSQNAGTLECWDPVSDTVRWTMPLAVQIEGLWSNAQFLQTTFPSDNGTDTDLLVCTVGQELFFVRPDSGELLANYSFDADIKAVFRSQNEFYVVLKSGTIERVFLNSKFYTELISLNCSIASVSYDANAGRILLGLAEQAQIVVLRQQLSDSSIILLDCPEMTAAYYTSAPVNLRITSHKNENGEYALWAWGLLSTEPKAKTDWGNRKILIDVTQQKGRMILWYEQLGADDYTAEDVLYGWDLDRNERCAAYPLTDPDWDTAGIADNRWLLYKTEGFGISEFHQLDLTTGEENIHSLKQFEGTESIFLFCSLSSDPTHLMILHRPQTTNLNHEVGCQVDCFDLETGKWLSAQTPLFVTAKNWRQNLCSGAPICDSPDGSLLAVWADNRVQLLDRTTGELLQTLPIDCSSDCEFNFLSDDLLVVWGDNHHLTLWSISQRQIVQEDRYTIDSITYLTVDRSAGNVQVMGGDAFEFTTYLYQYNAERGTFERYLAALNCMVSQDGTEAFGFKSCGFFPVYSLDELIANANDFLHGRTLSQTDCIRFYLQNSLT